MVNQLKVLFVSSGNHKEGISPFVKAQGESLKRDFIEIGFFQIKNKGFIGYTRNIFELRSILAKFSPDIIHAHYGFSGIVSMLAKKNQKLIVSLMGSELYDPTSKFNQFSVLKYIASKLNLFFCKYFYDMTIVKSNRMKEKLLRNTTCVVIPNGVDFKLFYPKERTRISTIKAKADEKLVLSVVYKESKIKNLDLLRDSMKYLHTENVRLIIATNLKQHELLDYYNRADVFVLTSFYEGSPNVIKEAMACNCPIVSTDVGDVKNLISSTKGCYICAFDSKDVAAKIDLALSFNARTNGREQIKHLELNQISNQIISVYVQV